MNKPRYKDEVYIATKSEPWEETQQKAEEHGYDFFCESALSQGKYFLYQYVKVTETGLEVYPALLYKDLEERLDPPKPIWATETEVTIRTESDPYENDAWKRYYDLLNELSTRVEVRSDIHVTAKAYDRGVELVLFDGTEPLKRNFISTGSRNIGTMRELAKALNDACDFVEEQNPKWASQKGMA